MNLHKLNLNDIRGFGRKKPALGFSFLMGSLGIGGIPLWSGYVSKTLLHENMVEYAKAVGEGATVLVNPGMASASAGMPGIVTSLLPVSYTHLDVYKRQDQNVILLLPVLIPIAAGILLLTVKRLRSSRKAMQMCIRDR